MRVIFEIDSLSPKPHQYESDRQTTAFRLSGDSYDDDGAQFWSWAIEHQYHFGQNSSLPDINVFLSALLGGVERALHDSGLGSSVVDRSGNKSIAPWNSRFHIEMEISRSEMEGMYQGAFLPAVNNVIQAALLGAREAMANGADPAETIATSVNATFGSDGPASA